MRSRRPLRSLLVALCCLASFIKPASAAAQAHPSFGGTGVRVDSAITGVTVATTGDVAFQIGDIGSGWGTPLTITQSNDSLVVSFAHFVTYDGQPRLRYVFALDGGETVNRVMIGHAESAPRARAGRARRSGSLRGTPRPPKWVRRLRRCVRRFRSTPREGLWWRRHVPARADPIWIARSTPAANARR